MIRFYTQSLDFVLKSKRIFRAWLEALLEQEHRKSGRVHYVFCSDAYLLDLNQRFLGHDYATDVIAFEYEASDAHCVNGDIFVGIEKVKADAREYGVPFYDELARVMAHGLLHLCSYDDKTPEQQRLMHGREDFYLCRLKQLFELA